MSALIPFLALDQTCEQVQAWVNEQLTCAGFRILLVYGKQDDPATFVIHGQDGRAWLSLVSPVGQRTNQHLETAIRRALRPQFSNALDSVEAVYEET
jgi:hypothetical protein